MDMDFSRTNLQYLIRARELARQDPERVVVMLGVSREVAELLAELTPEGMAQFAEIKSPLIAPRPGLWCWKRLVKAANEERTDEICAIVEHLNAIIAGIDDESARS